MRVPVPLAYAASAALHAAAMLGLAAAPPLAPGETVTVEIVEVAPPPPPPAPLPPLEPPPQVPPARAAAPPPRRAPRAPPPAPSPSPAPPPPSATPPEDAPPPERAPVRVGISMSSSTAADGVAAPAGNTLHGELPREAPEPSDVRPYRSDRYVPPTQVTVLPRPIGEFRIPSSEYPPEALRRGIEGRVVLSLLIDETGAVADARVVSEPGHGLGEAAARAVRRHLRWVPGRRGDDPVATTITFKVLFELP